MSLEIRATAARIQAMFTWKLFLIVNGETISYLVFRDNRAGVSKHEKTVDGTVVDKFYRRDGFEGKYMTESALAQALKPRQARAVDRRNPVGIAALGTQAGEAAVFSDEIEETWNGASMLQEELMRRRLARKA